MSDDDRADLDKIYATHTICNTTLNRSKRHDRDTISPRRAGYQACGEKIWAVIN